MRREEIIAGRYAAGLAEYAAETGEIAGIRRDLRLVAGLVDPRSEAYSPEMAEFLASPLVGAEEKADAAGAILAGLGVCAAAGSFFRLLVRHGRAALLPRIDARFDALAAALTGECSGVAETAMPLAPEQIARLEEALSGALGRTVRLRQRLEPGLLAGARITVGDRIFDGSLLGKWRQLRSRLASGATEARALPREMIDRSKGEQECGKN